MQVVSYLNYENKIIKAIEWSYHIILYYFSINVDDSRGAMGSWRGRGAKGRTGSVRSSIGVGRGHQRGGTRTGRGASATAKTIALNRPRCMGALKHTPDPQRLKGLFSPVSNSQL